MLCKKSYRPLLEEHECWHSCILVHCFCMLAKCLYLPFALQTYFALWPTVSLYDWTHCSGSAEKVVGERSPQEAGIWTAGGWRYQGTSFLQGPMSLNCLSLKHLFPCNLSSFICNSFILLFCLTGTELGWLSTKEGCKSIQARAEERTRCGELCRGIHWDGSCLFSSQHTPEHRSSVPGQSSSPPHWFYQMFLQTWPVSII